MLKVRQFALQIVNVTFKLFHSKWKFGIMERLENFAILLSNLPSLQYSSTKNQKYHYVIVLSALFN